MTYHNKIDYENRLAAFKYRVISDPLDYEAQIMLQRLVFWKAFQQSSGAEMPAALTFLQRAAASNDPDFFVKNGVNPPASLMSFTRQAGLLTYLADRSGVKQDGGDAHTLRDHLRRGGFTDDHVRNSIDSLCDTRGMTEKEKEAAAQDILDTPDPTHVSFGVGPRR